MSETLFEALRESHEIQRALMRKLMRSKVGQLRIDLFTQLRIELAAHEASEERYLYAQILMDDRGLDSSRDALADHHKMDIIVADLQTRDHAGRGWMQNVKKLSMELHDHLREEETIFFQLSGKILTNPQKIALAKKYRTDYTRMHKKLERDEDARSWFGHSSARKLWSVPDCLHGSASSCARSLVRSAQKDPTALEEIAARGECDVAHQPRDKSDREQERCRTQRHSVDGPRDCGGAHKHRPRAKDGSGGG
jgi:hypothetical protein